MSPIPRPGDERAGRDRTWRRWALAALGALGLSATAWAGASGGRDGQWDLPFGPWLASASHTPWEYRALQPTSQQLAGNAATIAHHQRIEPTLDPDLLRTEGPGSRPGPRGNVKGEPAPPRVASASGRSREPGASRIPSVSASASAGIGTGTRADLGEVSDLVLRANQAVAACRARFREVQDYTCTFHKRERIDGRITQPYIMAMKARTEPHSVYFKFQRPKPGREAIYVAGRHGGKVVVHDVGWGKLLAGTMKLDPNGSMAMEECRHPVTEAGIGALIETVARHWAVELKPGESRIKFQENARVGNHLCTMIETVHPQKHPSFLFHMVKLYIDHEHGLPIRFEAYDWPSRPGVAPQLVEEYSYLNLQTNVGLVDRDFDAANPEYSYGRF